MGENVLGTLRVVSQLEQHLNGIRSVTFLAGRRYREFLEPSLRSRGLVVSIPIEGLRIGEQLRWLTGELRGDSRARSGVR